MADSLTSTFAGHKYLSLESFRKNGEGVATPVWFAEEGGVFYLISEADAGKVKRIRNNPRVRVAPCDFRGALKGGWVEATARLLPPDEAAHAEALLTAKYGLIKRLGNFFAKFSKHGRTYIAVQPLEASRG